MRRTEESQLDLDALKAAFLCARHGLTQQEIGRLLGGLSQSQVSRLLKRAEGRGWLQRNYIFNTKGLPDDRLVQLERLTEPGPLLALLARIRPANGVRVRGVHVVDSGPGHTARGWPPRLARFGRAAAGILLELLGRSDVLAVTWGLTVSKVVDGIKARSRPSGLGRNIRVLPVCGEPLEEASDRDTSSHVAERLHQNLGSTAQPPPSLTGVPALIPRHFRGTAARVIRKFVEQAGSYREIFSSPSPLIDTVDSLLTSAGPARKPMGFIHDELLRAGSTPSRQLTSDMLSELVVGDLGGVLIPRPGLSPAARKEVHELAAMWTGAKLPHFDRIARQAARSKRPGIIVVSLGREDRAEIIGEAIRCGLVNELIIDRVLADELTRTLSKAA